MSDERLKARMKDLEDRVAVMSSFYGRVKEAVLSVGTAENIVRTMDEIAVYTNMDAINRRLDRLETELHRTFQTASPDSVNFAMTHMLDVMRVMHRRMQALEKTPAQEALTFEQWVAKNVFEHEGCDQRERRSCVKDDILEAVARSVKPKEDEAN